MTRTDEQKKSIHILWNFCVCLRTRTSSQKVTRAQSFKILWTVKNKFVKRWQDKGVRTRVSKWWRSNWEDKGELNKVCVCVRFSVLTCPSLVRRLSSLLLVQGWYSLQGSSWPVSGKKVGLGEGQSDLPLSAVFLNSFSLRYWMHHILRTHVLNLVISLIWMGFLDLSAQLVVFLSLTWFVSVRPWARL